ncbi:MAG: DUF1015 domain-containing protein [Lachnospiraceae bacterium]|nr:DUF1015 domain-containing protein [Lachnospiraceae bacterium]
MAIVRPFKAIRPRVELAAQVAALPYDVYSREEAWEKVQGNPRSFLNIDRAETQFGSEVDTYADCVYEKARELLDGQIADGTYETEENACYYLYELVMNGRSQTGIVGCCSIDDYANNVIKKHENTRADKEKDRIRHVDTCSAQTGPIFLAYRRHEELSRLISEVKTTAPLYDFTADDGIIHRAWRISEADRQAVIGQAFAGMDSLYIADGHHRAASAVRVGQMRRAANPGYTGEEEFNYFLSVIFAEDELMIMDYNRVVADLNGFTEAEFMDKVSEVFDIALETETVHPAVKGQVGMYLGGKWYRLSAKASICSEDAVKGLDVSLLQDYVLMPVLGIMDPKIDKRIDFVGGIRGLSELERRVDEGMAVAFSMYPTSIGELFAVADAGLLMPPKSTWFEPKLRSGLFIHRI